MRYFLIKHNSESLQDLSGHENIPQDQTRIEQSSLVFLFNIIFINCIKTERFIYTKSFTLIHQRIHSIYFSRSVYVNIMNVLYIPQKKEATKRDNSKKKFGYRCCSK